MGCFLLRLNSTRAAGHLAREIWLSIGKKQFPGGNLSYLWTFAKETDKLMIIKALWIYFTWPK